LAHSQAATAIALANAGKYIPLAGIGPCAAPSERNQSTYWLTDGNVDFTSCDGNVTILKQSVYGGGGGAKFLGYSGWPSGYPPKFTASFQIVFSDGSTPVCVDLRALYGVDNASMSWPADRDIRICSDGAWTDLVSNTHGKCSIANAPAKIAIAVAADGVTFSVNKTDLGLGKVPGGIEPFDTLEIAATSTQLGRNDGTLGSIAVSGFQIVPNK
jgi:hypothetical protein